MTDKISLKELVGEYTILNSAILNAIDSNVDYGIIPSDYEQEIKFDFKINGVNASLRSFLINLKYQIDSGIEAAAADLLRKRLNDSAFDSIDNIRKMVKKCENELFETYFPNDPEFNQRRYDE